MNFRQIVVMLQETFNEWSADNCLRLGASLSFYTLGSLIPLLLIVLAIVTFVLHFTGSGQDLQQQLLRQITQTVHNPALADQILSGLTSRKSEAAGKGALGTIVGIVVLLVTASGVFGELDSAFNLIWDVPSSAQGTGLWGFIRSKFFSFTLVLGVAFLLLVAQVITVVLTALQNRLPLGPLWTGVNLLVQLGLITLIFALLFKFLPDRPVAWNDVWLGGLLTALLWIVGQHLLALYFAYVAGFSSYGSLGAVLAFLLYVYYSSQILFMGGEFTQVYARRHGSQQPATSRPAISREAALMVTTAATSGAARHAADIDALRRRQYAAVATAGMVGLVGGAAIGGVGLVMGVARGARKLRGRGGSSFRR